MDLLKSLFGALDIIALERLERRHFKVIGSLPGWFVRLYPEAVIENRLNFGGRFPFLENFLIDAEKFWSSEDPGRLKSGAWVEVDAFGKERQLEASAVNLDDRKILLIELPGVTFEERQSLIQKGREQKLNLRTQSKIRQALQKTEARYKALLQVIPEAVFFLNDEGICLDFAGDEVAAENRYVGKKITEIFPNDLGRQLFELTKRPLQHGEVETLECQVETGSGTRLYRARIISSGEKEILVLIH